MQKTKHSILEMILGKADSVQRQKYIWICIVEKDLRFVEKVLRLGKGSRTPQKTRVRLSSSRDQILMISTLQALKEMVKDGFK